MLCLLFLLVLLLLVVLLLFGGFVWWLWVCLLFFVAGWVVLFFGIGCFLGFWGCGFFFLLRSFFCLFCFWMLVVVCFGAFLGGRFLWLCFGCVCEGGCEVLGVVSFCLGFGLLLVFLFVGCWVGLVVLGFFSAFDWTYVCCVLLCLCCVG